MEQSLLLKALGDSPKLRILDYLLDFKLNDFTKKEIVEALEMSKQTFYKINLENPIVKMLIEHETQLSLQIAEQEKAKTQKPVAIESAKMMR